MEKSRNLPQRGWSHTRWSWDMERGGVTQSKKHLVRLTTGGQRMTGWESLGAPSEQRMGTAELRGAEETEKAQPSRKACGVRIMAREHGRQHAD